jgi:restriction endonuclease Mrr
MIDYDVGMSVASRYDVRRVDLDYFTEDGSPVPASAP